VRPAKFTSFRRGLARRCFLVSMHPSELGCNSGLRQNPQLKPGTLGRRRPCGRNPCTTHSSPQTPEHPETCVTAGDDDDAALRRWRLDASKAIAAALPRAEHCFDGVGVAAYVQVSARQEADGHLTTWISGSTLDDCRVTECMRESMARAAANETPARPIAESDSQEVVWFDPRGNPRLHLGATPDVPLSPEGPCVDRDRLPVSGRLPAERIQGVVRAAAPAMRRCYEKALTRDPNLHGRLVTRFVIGLDGRVQHADVASNSLPDCDAVSCIEGIYAQLHFDAPQGGSVTVVYPLRLEPNDSVQ
jgi:hypothetical protein